MTPSARDSRRLAQDGPHGCRGNQEGSTGRRKPSRLTKSGGTLRNGPRSGGVGRAGVEERLRVTQDRPVPWGSGGPPALRSPFRSKEATRPSQDTLCAHSVPFAETLSALLTSLENASSPCETHPGVSSELSKQRRVFVPGVPRARQSPGRPGLQLCTLSRLPDLLGGKLRPETVSGSLLLPSTAPGAW